MPEYIKGVINLRGLVVPILDVRKRLHFDIISYNHRTCIIVVSIKEKLIGLIVDEVSEVVDIPENQISDPPLMEHIKADTLKELVKLLIV
jgi:purine-binding chemotaxis protein CheW